MKWNLSVGKSVARMDQFASRIIYQPWWTWPGKSFQEPSHVGFETGEAPVERFELAACGSLGFGRCLELSRGVEDGRAREIGEATGISQDGNGLEATEFVVGDAKIDETIANVHRGP
jgi:hypothetical protein